jgi:hypothetical protein
VQRKKYGQRFTTKTHRARAIQQVLLGISLHYRSHVRVRNVDLPSRAFNRSLSSSRRDWCCTVDNASLVCHLGLCGAPHVRRGMSRMKRARRTCRWCARDAPIGGGGGGSVRKQEEVIQADVLELHNQSCLCFDCHRHAWLCSSSWGVGHPPPLRNTVDCRSAHFLTRQKVPTF